MKVLQIIKNNQQNSILVAILIAHFLSHLYGLSDPPNGFHAWRESDTAAVAESFYKETKNIFKPRIHQRKNTTGITGMEFPIYNYTVALCYQVTGLRHSVPRLITIVIGLLGILGTYYLGKLLFSKSTGLWAAFFMTCSPLYFFYSRKIQPDIIVVTSIVWSLYFFIKSDRKLSNRYLLFSLFLLILGASVKPTALAIGLPILVYLILTNKNRLIKVLQIKYILFLILAVGIPMIWYQYAKYLQSEYGLTTFYLGGDLLTYWANTDWSGFFSRIFLSWLFELFLGTPIAIGLIIGIIYLRRITPIIQVLIAWIIGCYIMFFIVSEHMSNYHDYYGLIIIPPLSLLSAYYIPPMLKDNRLYVKYFAYIVIIAALFYVWPRIDQRYGDFNEQDFFNRRELINKYIPIDSRITIEDSSPAIQLYRAGRMGWRFRVDDQDEVLLNQHKQGAEYAIFFNRKISDNLLAHLEVLFSNDKITTSKFKDDKFHKD